MAMFDYHRLYKESWKGHENLHVSTTFRDQLAVQLSQRWCLATSDSDQDGWAGRVVLETVHKVLWMFCSGLCQEHSEKTFSLNKYGFNFLAHPHIPQFSMIHVSKTYQNHSKPKIDTRHDSTPQPTWSLAKRRAWGRSSRRFMTVRSWTDLPRINDCHWAQFGWWISCWRYPLRIKHGNGKHPIYSWCSHSKLQSSHGFSSRVSRLPRRPSCIKVRVSFRISPIPTLDDVQSQHLKILACHNYSANNWGIDLLKHMSPKLRKQ